MVGEQRHRRVRFGQTVYDEDGNELGRVKRFEEGGFRVTTVEGVSTRARAEGGAGGRTLLWRCAECGELGDIGDVPLTCPSCGASGESIHYCRGN